MKSTWTGERLETDVFTSNASEHLHRYAIAAGLVPGKRVLDIACGEGYGSNLLSGTAASVIGVDIDVDTVVAAQKKYRRANLVYKQGSAAAIPLETASVDVVVSFETIEHHDKHEEMMKEIKRVLVPGGVLLMSSPNRKNYSNGYKNPFHVKELYKEEFVALLQKHFRHTQMLSQLYCEASWVFPDVPGANQELESFSGDYLTLLKRNFHEMALYNISLASDQSLPTLGASTFENRDFTKRRLEELRNSYEYSMSFRVGKAVTFPGRLLRAAFRRVHAAF